MSSVPNRCLNSTQDSLISYHLTDFLLHHVFTYKISSKAVNTVWCAGWWCVLSYQCSHTSWKVLEFFLENSRTWKVLENHFGPGKSWKNILESHAFF